MADGRRFENIVNSPYFISGVANQHETGDHDELWPLTLLIVKISYFLKPKMAADLHFENR